MEVTASPSADGEPGSAHIREALRRRIPVVTSNKWPVALHGVELAELARSRGVAFRAESTVMSGTPVLSALVDGLAGAVPIGLRGLLNATANFILSRMAGRQEAYEDALAEAQTAGLAERDPAADVEGHDAVAKVMILSALVFGRQLRREQVACRGITDIARSEIEQAASGGARLKHVATLEFSEPDGAGDVTARVEPELVPGDDPLANIEGTTNAIVCRADPIGEVTIIGPGAGPQLAQPLGLELVDVADDRGLVVGQVAQRAAALLDPEPERRTAVRDALRGDLRRADVPARRRAVAEVQPARQLADLPASAAPRGSARCGARAGRPAPPGPQSVTSTPG